jgi:hypothetical protein
MAFMEHTMARSIATVTKWDRGRKLLSVTKLAAGGAIVAASVVGLVAGVAGHPTSNEIDVAVGLLGGCLSFLFLARTFHIFEKRQ